MDTFEIITIDEDECLKDAETSRNIPAMSRCLLCLESMLEPGKIKLLEHPVQALLRAVGITYESVLGCMGSGIGSLSIHGFCNECHALVKSSLDLLRAIEELQKRVKEKKLVIVSKAAGDEEEMHDMPETEEYDTYRIWNALRRLISQSYSACTVASTKVKVNEFHRRTQVAEAEADNYSDGGLTPDYDPGLEEAFEDDCHADNGTFQDDNMTTLLDDDVQCITSEEVTKPESLERRRSLRIRGEPAPGDTKVKQIKPLRKKVRRVVRKYELRKRITNRIETYSQQTRTMDSSVRRRKPTGTRRKRGHGLTAKFKQTNVAARFNRIKLIPQRTFDCRTCSDKFVTELTLELHQQEVHNLYQGNLEFKCANCDFSIRADQCRISQGVFMLEGTFKICTSFAELCERHSRCCENRITSVIRSAGPSSYEVPMAGFEAYICEICNKSFVVRRKYEHHKTIHLIEKKRSVEPEPCGLCGEKFSNKLEFMEHVASTHQLEKGPGNKYMCMICHEIYTYRHEEPSIVKIEMGDESEIQVVGVEGQHYASLDDFRGRHLTTCGPVDPAAWIKCFECDRSYETRSTMLSHYAWKHEVEPQVCIQCEEEFPTYQNLVIHRRTHRTQEEPRYPCPRCPKSYPSPENVMYHVLVRHVNKSTPCTCLACGEGMKTAEELNDHIVDKHPEWTLNRRLPPKVKCGFCKKEFFTRAEADIHSELEHSEVADCPICKRTCMTDLKLQNHIWKDHGLEVGTKSQWMCAYCYEIFPNVNAAVVPALENCTEPQLVKEQTLKMFSKSHGLKCPKFVSETRQRKCFYCPQTFKTRDRMIEHEADEHTFEFNYICDQCGKSFASSGKLTAHRRHKHIPGKFKCPHSGCSKAYGSSEKLKNHITLHTGEKSFVCATCGKTFRLKHSLRVHEAIHDVNAPPVPCPMCGKLFKNKYQLHCHNFSVHKQGRKDRKKTKTATEATLDTNTTPVLTHFVSYNPSDMIVFSDYQMHDVQNIFQNAEQNT